MNPADLPIHVRLEWPVGVIQTGKAKKPNVQEFERDGKQYVAVTAELDPPFDHLAQAQAAIERLDAQETTMNDYTAEDFQNAMFAVLPKYGLRAHKSAGEFYWQRDGIKRATNPEMAAAGWRPVHELAPLTLDTLREAWGNAEQSEDCRVGDVLIRRVDRVMYYVYEADIGSHSLMSERVRILHRAPQPEPWEGLADVLRTTGVDGQAMDPEILASVLYERGVRVTGGDEK